MSASERAALDAEDLVVRTLGGHLVKKDTRRVAGAVSGATATQRGFGHGAPTRGRLDRVLQAGARPGAASGGGAR